MAIEMKPVESSNLEAIGYSAEDQILQVRFKSGKTWRYRDFPPSAYSRLMAAESKGKFFAAHVRGIYVSFEV